MTTSKSKKPSSDEIGAVAFYKKIKQDITKFIPVALCVIGEAMEPLGNDTVMDTSLEATFRGKRYNVTATFKIEPIN